MWGEQAGQGGIQGISPRSTTATILANISVNLAPCGLISLGSKTTAALWVNKKNCACEICKFIRSFLPVGWHLILLKLKPRGYLGVDPVDPA